MTRKNGLKYLLALALSGLIATPAAADDRAAMAAVQHDYEEMHANCPDDAIGVKVNKVDLAPKTDAYVIDFTSSGSCFGQPGQNSYLVVNGRKALAAEPGSISIERTGASGHATIKISGIGLCVVSYVWEREEYAIRMDRACHGMAHPTLQGLAAALRG